jgi:hypothetical protein
LIEAAPWEKFTAMKLTRRDTLYLRALSEIHAKQPSFLVLLKFYRLAWFLLFILGLCGGLLALTPDAIGPGSILVGTVIGAFLRDVNRILVVKRTWPITETITNWDAVSDLLRQK